MNSIYETHYELAEAGYSLIPICPGNHKGMSMHHNANCKAPGKSPLINDWTKRGQASTDEIAKWQHLWPNANIGLVLGRQSGLIGIDVDGEYGQKLLEEISLGDLPPTLVFTTPGGGKRYLYRIPEGTWCRKWSKSDPKGGHSELALLGEGQQTVIPPSIHANGKKYEWQLGCSPWDIDEIAMAPKWMVAKMTGKNQDQDPHDQTVQEAALPIKQEDPEVCLGELARRCNQFAEVWEEQKHGKLSEEKWFLWGSLLAYGVSKDVAMYFSTASTKHNTRSERRIEELAKDREKKLIRCSTIGCSASQTERCFQSVTPSKKMAKTPANFLNITESQNGVRSNAENNAEKAGLEIKDGQIVKLNGNKFSRHILSGYTLVFSAGNRFYRYRDGAYRWIDDNALQRMCRDILHLFVPDSWTQSFEKRYIEALKLDAPRVEKMDSCRDLLNLKNGMLHLGTYEIMPHSPAYYSSIQIPIDFDPSAKCPRWDQFLREVFENDRQRIAVAMEIMGYCLTSEVKAQKAFIALGEGSNGKSVYADILRMLCGPENVSAVPLKELENSFARLDLVDKTLNLVTESESDTKGTETEYFKAIVSGDPIRVERKFGDAFPYSPFCKLLFCMNSLPYSRDRSHGFMRRLLILPFNRKFSDNEKDRDLFDKLANELPGILNAALEGLRRLRANQYTFTQCNASLEAVSDYNRLIDPVLSFVEDCIVQAGSDSRIIVKDFVRAYQEWCLENGHKYASETTHVRFSRSVDTALRQAGLSFQRKKSSDRYFSGIALKAKRIYVVGGKTDDILFCEN